MPEIKEIFYPKNRKEWRKWLQKNHAKRTEEIWLRRFKKATGKTFTKLVNEYRVVHATKLLSESQNSITDICFECGFNNFSHFNKLFKEFTGKSASKYRGEMKRIIQ